MTGSAIDFIGEQRQALSPDAYGDLFRQYQTPLGEFLGANAREGWWATVAGQAQAQQRVNQAELFASEQDVQPMSDADWRASPFFRQAVPYRHGMTRAAARALSEIYDEQVERQRLIDGRPGLMATVAGFGAGVVGSIPTPENFIPFGGPALQAARAQRYSARLAAIAGRVEAAGAGGILARAGASAVTGSIDGLAGSAIAMPFVVPSRESFGDDVTFSDIVLDLAMGTVAGGAIGGGAGAVLGRRAAASGEAAGGPAHAPAPEAPVPQQDAALHALAATATQVAEGGDVNLAQVPPEVRALVAALREDNRYHAAQVLPAAGENAGGSDRAGVLAQQTGADAGDARPAPPVRLAAAPDRFSGEGPDGYVRLDGGSIDLAVLPEGIADAQPLPVRLARGWHDPDSGQGRGLLHIAARRQGQIEGDPAEFVADVLTNFTQVRRGSDGSLLVVRPIDGARRGDAALVSLRRDDGGFYEVITAGTFRDGYLRRRELLWERERRSLPGTGAGPDAPLQRGGQSAADLGAGPREGNIDPAVEADTFRPSDDPPPPPPMREAPAGDTAAKLAERMGLDTDPGEALAELARLQERGDVPAELLQDVADAEALIAKTQNAAEAWQAAAACAVRG